MRPWYATREQVSNSLEIMNVARANTLIDMKIAAASESVDGLLHRRFYPELKTLYFDWPSSQYSPTWMLELGDNELISLTTLTAGGTVISASDYWLRRDDDKDEPPYSRIEIDRSSTAAFASGATSQRAISVLGTTGFGNTDTGVASASLSAGINASVTTLVLNPSSGVYDVGVGSLILIGTERLQLIERRMSYTGQLVQSAMTALMSDTIVDVTDGTLFAVGETVLIDAERMRIDDIAGNNLIVTRAWDGTVLAAHAGTTAVFALRTFSAKRGVQGTTAASHSTADPAYAHTYPGLINELCIAETVVMLEQNASAYARVVGTGASAREAAGKGLEDIRARAVAVYGRKCRSGAI